MPKTIILYLTVSFWFLISLVLGGGGRGAAPAGWLNSFMHLSGPSRAIKFLFAPAPPPPHSMGPETSIVAFVHKTTFAHMIYTAMCIMFWMRAYPLLGQVGGGWALEILSFFVPQMALAYWLDAQKTLDFQGPTPSHLPLYIRCINS